MNADSGSTPQVAARSVPIPAVAVLGSEQIERLIGRVDVMQAMRGLFTELGLGKAAQPAQVLTLFPDGSGDFISYLGVLAEARAFGAKLSPYISRPDGALVTAWTLLMSMDSGRPLALCDAGRLTTERTAATTALAVDFLARDSATKLAVIGSGAIASAHVRYTQRLRLWSEIRVSSPSLPQRPDRQAAMRELDARVSIVADTAAAIDGADVVLLCTSSGKPVVDPARLRAPALITSISTNVTNAHEVPPGSLGAMDVYCDYRSTTPGSAAEMRIAAAEHGWSAEAIKGDLAELATGRAARPAYERHVFFRSIGLGLEDIAVARAVYERWSAEQATQ